MKIPYFCCIGAELKRYAQDFDFMNQVYLYKVPTDDSIDEVLSEDYFKAISNSVLQDDIVYIYEASAEILHECRFDKQNGHITAVPLASDETLTGAVTSIIHDNLTPNKLLKSDENGKVAVSDCSENDFVKVDGSSIMTGPLKFRAGSMRGAIAGGLNGLTFFKMDSEGNLTQIASLSDTQFIPASDDTLDIGTSVRKVERIYLSKINNGYDIDVPVTNSSDTIALKTQVDLAANSGSQLYTTGVWYAKMYAATVVPTGAGYNGRKYADFSQVDSDNNPVIKIYTCSSGAWTLTETITPPATYNGYITVTSKIWDIAEQAGQQGGQVLWDYTHKTFTPYPKIVSFENAALTGVSTAPTPTSSSPNNQIATKGYVDSFSGANTSLSNLTTTGKANISSIGTYDSSATYSAGTVGAAISNKVDKGHEVIAFQAPTAQNNYTWYRKYADGWVEQGGYIPGNVASVNSSSFTVTLPVAMADSAYTLSTSWGYENFSTMNGKFAVTGKTANNFTYSTQSFDGNARFQKFSWQVSGMAAS